MPRGNPHWGKAKIPSPNRNRNKNKKINQAQTMYQSSDEENKQSLFNKITQEKLDISYKPQKIIGRQKEKHKITDFINCCLMKEINNRCLYISGCPGLGKTITVLEIIKQIEKNTNSKRASFQYINCLSLKQPSRIYKQFLIKSKNKLESLKKQPQNLAIEFDKFLKLTKIHYFFVIDEVDFLYTKNQNVLYNISQWASQGNCNFSILLIANTMDLPEKLSPKITSRMGSWRMCFKPYSSNQIKKIIQERLQGTDFFQSKAIDFAVKKFSMYTSDLRKIFNLLKDIIENRKGIKKITIQTLTQVWGRLVQEEDISWKQQIPDIYLIVIDMIKKQGGSCHSYELFSLLSQNKVDSNELNMILMDLREMGLIKMLDKDYKGCRGWNVSLIDANI